MDEHNAHAVREWTVGRVTLVIDNESALYFPVRVAAIEAAMTSGCDRDGFVMMLDGRGDVRREEVADVVGAAVCDTIREWLDLNDPLHVMLVDLLDLGDSTQRLMFGEHYMPEAGDWPGDDE